MSCGQVSHSDDGVFCVPIAIFGKGGGFDESQNWCRMIPACQCDAAPAARQLTRQVENLGQNGAAGTRTQNQQIMSLLL